MQHVQRSAGTDFEWVGNSLSWTSTTTATQFSTSEEVRVAQSFCGEEPVAWSDPIEVAPEPSSMGPAAVPSMYDQQELIRTTLLTQGTIKTLTSSTAGSLPTLASWPAPQHDVDIGTMLSRPLSAGETVQVFQQLCDGDSTGTSAPARSCDELPAVEIVAPRTGDAEVRLAGELVLGSTIRVWSVEQDREIGDSSGPIVNVTPPLVAGETLLAMQQLSDGCRSERHFEIEVQ